MKRREWMKVMMPLLAFAVAVPAPVMAADTTDTVLIRQKEEGAAAEEGRRRRAGRQTVRSRELRQRSSPARRLKNLKKERAIFCPRAGNMCWTGMDR